MLMLKWVLMLIFNVEVDVEVFSAVEVDVDVLCDVEVDVVCSL